jgi:hypothetical protein
MPAEIQLMRVGPRKYIGWPGECFVEYSLALRREDPETFIISLANGELQGYIVTEEAAERGTYEAGNALFSWQSGELLVQATKELQARIK